ncbi:hypothetical protein FRC10_012283 [Ceratobasidium sp. 414]|nr:hypothetical protein FRC10_012283 [Ceratobasidium sp. 414]
MGGSGYQRDEIAHIAHFAGFHMDFSHPATDSHEYLQAHMTDKSVSYHTNGLNKAKHTSALEVLTNWQKVHNCHCQPLAQAFLDSVASHPAAIRIELHVPFKMYLGYQWHKATVVTSVLNYSMEAIKGQGQLMVTNLLVARSLLIILVWMLNSLVNCLDDSGNYDHINHAGSVHTIINNTLIPIQLLRMYCLHSLYLSSDGNHVPRISSHHTLTTEKILYFCSSSQEGCRVLNVLQLFRAGAGNDEIQEAQPLPPCHPNKQHCIRTRPVDDAPDMFQGCIDDLEEGEHYSSQDDDNEECEAPASLSQQVSDIIHALSVQIFTKVPNRAKPKGGPSTIHYNNKGEEVKEEGSCWCTLEAEELVDITSTIFANVSKPPEIFVSHHDYGKDYDKWMKKVNTYFPTSHKKDNMPWIQGLSQLNTWDQWGKLIKYAPPKAAIQMVKEARQYATREWVWLPWCMKD